MSNVRKPTKKPAPPAYRSSAPVCDCGSGIPRSETAEIPSSGGRRGCQKCFNRKYAAYADSDGGAEYGDDPTSGSGWHYSRNPPQNFTITSGGRRIRVAGGNVFPSKRDALAAAAYLRATDGGDYRVRAIKPGDSVVRVAVANGKKSTRAGKKRGATGVRRSMSNGTPTITLERLVQDMKNFGSVLSARNIQNNRRYSPEQKAMAAAKAETVIRSGDVDYLLKMPPLDVTRLTDIVSQVQSSGPRMGTMHSKAEDDAERYVRELTFLSGFCILPEMVPVDRQMMIGKFHTRRFGGLDTLAQRILAVGTEYELSRDEERGLDAEWRNRTFGAEVRSDEFAERYRD